MSMDERIQFLLDAAARAEREGARRVAMVLRTMAHEARPLATEDGRWILDPCTAAR